MFAGGATRAAVAAPGGCAAALMLSGRYVDVGALQHHTTSYSVSGPVQILLVQAHAGNVDVTGDHSSHVSVTEQISYRAYRAADDPPAERRHAHPRQQLPSRRDLRRRLQRTSTERHDGQGQRTLVRSASPRSPGGWSHIPTPAISTSPPWQGRSKSPITRARHSARTCRRHAPL